MAKIVVRFYEELNEYLPAEDRKTDLCLELPPGSTVGWALDETGVPRAEVEIILVNGESVGFDHMAADGDRVSVYPVFESLDVAPLVRVRDRPLRRPLFVADVHLGRLARYLRMLGFDTVYRNDLDDDELMRISCREGRVLLTRDRRLLDRKAITHGLHVEDTDPLAQIKAMVTRLSLQNTARPLARCLECNCPLEDATPAQVATQTPERIRTEHGHFRRCPECGRIFWRGSHYQRMRRSLDEILAAASPTSS